MKRILARWFISRSLDSRIPIPHRIQRWISVDPELTEFQNRATALSKALRHDAQESILRTDYRAAADSLASKEKAFDKPNRRHGMAAVVVREGTTQPSFASWAPTMGFGIAACLASWMLMSYVFSDRPEKAKEIPVPVASLPNDANEARDLLANAWAQGQHAWHRLHETPIGVPPRQPFPLQGLKINLTGTTTAAGTAVARSWLVVEEGLRREHSQLSQMVRTGFSYFTKELPSAALEAAGIES